MADHYPTRHPSADSLTLCESRRAAEAQRVRPRDHDRSAPQRLCAIFGAAQRAFRRASGVAGRSGVLILALLLAASLEAAPPGLTLPHGVEMNEDADLHAVQFVDPQVGWAVGDRGVIWSTLNGGRVWTRQTTPVTCRLFAVHFVNRQVGWAVGGRVHPYTEETTGVVLRTRDGGQHWMETPALSLPMLRDIRFFDEQQGWALGAHSPLFPTGLFRTRDGGRTWSSVPMGSGQGLLAGDFFDPDHGMAVGRDGALWEVRGVELHGTRTPPVGNRALRAVRASGPGEAWLAGDDGLLMRSQDYGRSWQLAGPELAANAGFDLQAIAVRDGHCWIAGAPGTRLFHSADQGRTWEDLPTGQSLPIRSLCFVTPEHGWAVGALGTILATSDGGRTWTSQRNGGERAALLGLLSDARRTPLEVLVRAAAEEGYLTVVEALVRRDVEAAERRPASLDDRLEQAIVDCGGSVGRVDDGFPLRQPGIELTSGEISAMWGRLHDSDGLAALEKRVVRELRMWRPDVVVVDGGDSPIDRLVAQVVVGAIDRAGDPTSHIEQLTGAGLRPWKARKLFASSPQRTARKGPLPSGTLAIDGVQAAPRLGVTLADYADRGRGLLEQHETPRGHQLRLVQTDLRRETAVATLFAGLVMHPGGEARREQPPLTGALDSLTRRAQLRRTVESLMDGEGPVRDDARLGQLCELTRDLPSDNAARMLYLLADRYRRAGRFELAEGAFERLVQQHGAHELAAPALEWLIAANTSGELAWRMRRSTYSTEQSMGHEEHVLPGALPTPTPLPDVAGASPIPGARPAGIAREGARPDVMRAGHVTTAAGAADLELRRRHALELGELARRLSPELLSTPRVRCCLHVAERSEGAGDESERFFRSLASRPVGDGWWQIARGELWYQSGPQGTQSQAPPPQAVTTCERIAQPPLLDGRLDDPCWQNIRPLPLLSGLRDDAEWPTQVRLAWDAEHLYWSAECTRPPRGAAAGNTSTATTASARQRDAELAAQDRVQLLLDIDRDYSTYYELEADHRGWGADRLAGDAGWNPRWYIAHAEDGVAWTIEAAIPWSELAPAAPRVGEAWACGLQRVVPSLGLQAWSRPAAVEPRPDGFGLVIFR